MVRTNATRRAAWFLVGLLAVLAASLVTPAAIATQTEESAIAEGTETDNLVGQVEIRVEATGAVTTRSMVSDLETLLLDIQETITIVVGARPESPLVIRFVSADDDPAGEGWIALAPETWVNDDATVAIIDLDAWLQLPEVESENRFRHLIARRWLEGASGGAMPPALIDGFARYLETPVLAQQARLASMVQQAYLDGELPSWSEMAASADVARTTQDESLAARRTALAAFLVERYGARVIAELATGYASEPDADPVDVIVDVTGQTPERLDVAWEEYLAAWFAGGWRSNVFSALDLQPAEDLFARGAYEAAVDRANRTLLLTTSLDDRVGSAEAERVAAQGSVGMQAEALMTDAEDALRDHDYARALVLLDRAEDQYALLPEDHRPADLIKTWRGLATDGTDAIGQLDQAHADSVDWFRMRGARLDAVEAGSTFATLGDAERVALAQQLVDELNARLFRLVLALGGATVLLVGWLLVWSWNRAPGRVHWPSIPGRARSEATI